MAYGLLKYVFNIQVHVIRPDYLHHCSVINTPFFIGNIFHFTLAILLYYINNVI